MEHWGQQKDVLGARRKPAAPPALLGLFKEQPPLSRQLRGPQFLWFTPYLIIHISSSILRTSEKKCINNRSRFNNRQENEVCKLNHQSLSFLVVKLGL